MLVASAITVARRRPIAAGSVLALAAIVVFAADPIATLTPGFHLSFAAVVLLVWLARRRDVGTQRGGPLAAARQLVVMQVFLMFGLLPLTALIFQRFSLVATPVNLVAVPLFSFLVVPLTLAGLAVGEISDNLAELVMGLAARCIDGLGAVIAWAANLPMGHWSLAALSGGAILLVLVPLAWVVLPPGWPARRVAVLGVIAVVAWKPPPPPAGCFDTWVLDVGQGLAVAIETRHALSLYDTGIAWRGGGSSAEQVIVPFLRSRGIVRIDRLVVSHSDVDHSGGVGVLRDQFDVDFTIFGEPPPGDAWGCSAGQSWWSGAVWFELLHPPAPLEVDGNDASCVLRVSAGPHALLLTGDIEAGVERDLVQRRARLGADVAVVPHHGSLTSSSVPFVNSVRADVAIVSAAHANRWGFPKQQVVERWQGGGAALLTTARAGAVYLRICAAGGVVELRREREERRRFWHADS
jgi:competence protein ComEC